MRSSPLAAALLGTCLVVGCSGDEPGEPAPSPSPSEEAPADDDATAAPGPELPFDCEAVAAAQAELGAAATAELERLAIDRGAPEAFTVVLLVTSQGAARYWDAVEQAATPAADDATTADLEVVSGYWASLDDRLAAIEVADATPAAVQAAGDELASVGASRPDDALAPAQQRVQDVLAATCGTEPTAPAP